MTDQAKYHQTSDGIKKCSDTTGRCPYRESSGHVSKETAQFIQNFAQSSSTLWASDNVTARVVTPIIHPRTALKGMNNNSYYGAQIDAHSTRIFNDFLKAKLTEKEYQEFTENRNTRDRGSYHITVLSPKETRQMRKKGIEIPDLEINDLVLAGVGSTENKTGDKQAWYIIAQSEKIETYRRNLGLGHKDLHVTLAFKNGDVHDSPKGMNTLL